MTSVQSMVAAAVLVIGCFGCSGLVQSVGGDGRTGADAGPGRVDGGTERADGGSAPDPDGGGTVVDSGTPGQPEVRFTGRWEFSDPAHPKANYPGSGFEAAFSGTQVSVTLSATPSSSATDRGLYFVSVVDSAAPVRTKLTSGQHSYALATGLASGSHTVRLALDTEGMYGYVQFRSLELGTGTLLAPPARAPLRMEVVGDSITCGYGNLGPPTVEDQSNNWSAPTCNFTTDTESNYMAYGSVLARLLGAEVVSICYSGLGVYEDLDGNIDSPSTPQLPTYYQDALVDCDGVELHEYGYPVAGHSAPYDVVLVNLGTNDISGAKGVPALDVLKTAYFKLLGEIRANNPAAQVFLTLGPMSGDAELDTYAQRLDAIITAYADPKLHRLDLDTQDPALGVGCDWHPTMAEDLRVALRLAHQMEPILGVTALTADPRPYTP